MIRSLSLTALCAACAAGAFPAAAQTSAAPVTAETSASADAAPPAPARTFRPVLGVGATFGGDTLSSATFTDGSSQKVKAGQLLLLYGGFEYRNQTAFSVQATVGYHVDDVNADNGSLRFGRYPLEVLGRYHVNEQWSWGGGLRYVTSAKSSASGAASSLPSVSFDNTVGAVIEGEYRSSPNVGWKVRYVSEKYDAKAPFAGARIDGSHVGLLVSWYL